MKSRKAQKKLFLALHGKNERLLAQGIRRGIRKDLLSVSSLNRFDAVSIINGLPFKHLEKEFLKGYERSALIGSMLYVSLESEKKRINPFFSEIWNNWILRSATLFIAQHIVSIKQTLVDDLKKVILAAIAENADLFDVTKVVKDFVKQPDFYRWQAMRIARTETTTAMNSATKLAADESGVLLNKVWIAAEDSRTRPSHAALDDVEIPKDQNFNNGLAYPGDPRGSAGEIINCRCSLAYEPIRDDNGNLIFN